MIMNKTQLIVKNIVLIVVIGGLTMCSTTPPGLDRSVRRGKVSESETLELAKGSASSLQLADSTRIISGTVVGDSTSTSFPMIPRRFPNWFIIGLDSGSSIVEYKIVSTVGTDSARVKNFYRRGRVWKDESSGKYWVCVLRRNGNPRGFKILIKNQKKIPPNFNIGCKRGEGKFIDYRLVEKGTKARVTIR